MKPAPAPADATPAAPASSGWPAAREPRHWRVRWTQESATVRAVESAAPVGSAWDVLSLVVMELPPEPGKSEEVSKESAAPAELPFLNGRRYLEKIGVRVPHIFLYDHPRGLVVLED